MWCKDSTYSRNLGPGDSHVDENRRSICPFTCVPKPTRSRPRERSCRSLAVWATTIGDRGNAIATRVSKVTREVAVAANVRGRKGSWDVSLLETPSYPIPSAQAASAGIAAKSLEANR